MSLPATLERLMNETVDYAAPVTDGGFGEVTYPTSVSVKARIEQGIKMVANAQGREVVSMTRCFMAPRAINGSAYTPVLTGRLTLPSGYVPSQPPIINVLRQNDEAELHHFVVFL